MKKVISKSSTKRNSKSSVKSYKKKSILTWVALFCLVLVTLLTLVVVQESHNIVQKAQTTSDLSLESRAAPKLCKTTLRVGSRGACVKALQKKLGITADGIFGPKTKAAVKKFQKKNGLVVDGIVGPKTLQKLQKSRPKPTVKPTQATGKSASGQAMPTGDLPGWKMIFSDDFTTDVPLGKFPSAVASKWDAYTDGTPDTAGNQDKPSKYYPSKVVSVKNGILNKYLHTENGIPMAAAIIPKLPGKADGEGQLYGRYVVRFRSDSLKGFKTAWLLWPDNGDYIKGGEVDFPEGDLDGNILAFLHHSDAAGKEVTKVYDSKAKYTSWHTATIEWLPDKISFMLDGKTIGSSTTGVPETSMGYIIQTESCLSESGCPAASTKGNLQIDWVVIYEQE